jgi:hypothetical protein
VLGVSILVVATSLGVSLMPRMVVPHHDRRSERSCSTTTISLGKSYPTTAIRDWARLEVASHHDPPTTSDWPRLTIASHRDHDSLTAFHGLHRKDWDALWSYTASNRSGDIEGFAKRYLNRRNDGWVKRMEKNEKNAEQAYHNQVVAKSSVDPVVNTWKRVAF